MSWKAFWLYALDLVTRCSRKLKLYRGGGLTGLKKKSVLISFMKDIVTDFYAAIYVPRNDSISKVVAYPVAAILHHCTREREREREREIENMT